MDLPSLNSASSYGSSSSSMIFEDIVREGRLAGLAGPDFVAANPSVAARQRRNLVVGYKRASFPRVSSSMKHLSTDFAPTES